MLDDLGVIDDPFAAGMLGPTAAAALWLARWLPARVRTRSLTLAGLAARVLWFDRQVADALDSGVSQVVIVGAGYDSRAWRFRAEGARFFELDHPATQQDKARRAPGPGPVYVEADLAGRSAGSALRARGLDGDRPSLVVMEGVTMYLTDEVVRGQLTDLTSSTAPGSRLAIDFYPPADSASAQHARQHRLQRLARAGSGEGLRLALAPDDAVALVEATGWPVTEVTDLRAAALALVPSESGLPVASVNPLKVMLAARR